MEMRDRRIKSSLELASKSDRNLSSWPNEWGAVYNKSGSSDWFSQSVASSTSWSDGLETDLAQSLQQQMRDVENILYRDTTQQLLPRSQLSDECMLWQKSYPHLRVLGEAVGSSSVECQTQSCQQDLVQQIDNIMVTHSKKSSNKSMEQKEMYDSEEIYKDKIKKAVIDQIFTQIWPNIVKRIGLALGKVGNQGDIVEPVTKLSLKNEYNFERVTCCLPLAKDQNLRARSGRRRAEVSAHPNMSAPVEIKPVVLECSIPILSCVSERHLPVRLPGPSLGIKFHSPERMLSPLVLQTETVKSASAYKSRLDEKKPDSSRQRLQYNAKTGRIITKDESRSGLRRNLKTSPPIPWSKHVMLPPIETSELAHKNSVVLAPLDSLRTKECAPEHFCLANCDVIQLKPSDRWRNRSNVIRKY